VLILVIIVVVVLSTTLTCKDSSAKKSTTSPENNGVSRSEWDYIQVGNTSIGSASFDRFGSPLSMSSDGHILAIGA
jgi:hypothetical protein